MSVFRTTVAAVVGAGCVAIAATMAAAGPVSAAASATPLKVLDAHIGDRSLVAATRDNPVHIDPKVRQTLSMTLLNNGPTPVSVRYLRLTGAVLGIHFVNYQASANVVVAPGQSETVSAPGDFFDVDGVATGFVNARMQAVDEQRTTVAAQPFVADVRGKLTSSEGLFFFEVLAFALVSLLDIGFSVARRRLPRNRFTSALLFAFAAASTVIVIVVGAAMARVALFESVAWLPALFVATAGAFFLGYVSPGRLVRTAPEIAEDRVIDLVAAGAVARATGEQERRTTGENLSHASGDHSGAAASVDLTAAQHESGEFSALSQHESGEFSAVPQHESGEFSAVPQHESGEFAAPQDESGDHDPVDSRDE